MKTKNFWMNAGVLLVVCALAALLTWLPVADVLKTMLPGAVISFIVLFVCRWELRVLPCIFCVLISLAGVPLLMMVLMTCGMILVWGAPMWVSGILCGFLGLLSTLAIFVLAYRIVHLGKNGVVTRANGLIAATCSLLYAVLDMAGYGLRGMELTPEASLMDSLWMVFGQNAILALLSQVVFYGAIWYFGVMMWRDVSGEDSEA